MYEQISTFINEAQYTDALELINSKKQSCSVYDDTLAILEAEVHYNLGNKADNFTCIQKGLQYNPKNAELYLMLGNYYLDSHPYQALLCYENAEYYCTDPELKDYLLSMQEQLHNEHIRLPKLTIIIPSYNAKNEMQLCLDSLRQNTPLDNYELIVVDNASTDGVREYLKKQSDITLLCNEKNIGFTAGCNQGIKHSAPYNDILLLNNDTIIPPNAIFWLRMGLYENISVGATGAVSNFAINNQEISETFETPSEYLSYALTHNIPMTSPYEHKLHLSSFALMLKRTALDNIGLLDEQFSPGIQEDDDLSYRMLQTGYQLLLCRNAFIYHFGRTSFGKDPVLYNRLLQENAEKFKKKWGFDCRYYSSERRELTHFIHHTPEQPLRILEIGCGLGASLGFFRNHYPCAQVYGMELDSTVAALAQKFIPTIIQGNIENATLDYPLEFFDYIIFADVLEHLRNPESVLCNIRKYLKPDGCVLASIPNIMHHTIIIDLLKGNFTYQDSGILDRTHVRFFTHKEVAKMFIRCGYQIADYNAIQSPPALSSEDAFILDTITKLPGVASQDAFNVYQFLIKAQVTP